MLASWTIMNHGAETAGPPHGTAWFFNPVMLSHKLWTTCIQTAAWERNFLSPCLNHCHVCLCFSSQISILISTESTWQALGDARHFQKPWLAFQPWLNCSFLSQAFWERHKAKLKIPYSDSHTIFHRMFALQSPVNLFKTEISEANSQGFKPRRFIKIPKICILKLLT